MNAEEIGRILDEIGDRIGPTGEHAWRIAVQWQITTGIVGIVGSLILLTMAAYALKRLTDAMKQPEENDDPPWERRRERGPLIAFSILIVFLAIVWPGVALMDSILRVLNPEYSVIRDLVQ